MIPEIAAVVAAAEAYVDDDSTVDTHNELVRAVEALRMRRTRPVGQPTYEEEDREWGEVTVGDQIRSRAGKWHEVTQSVVNDSTGKIKVNIKGSPNPLVRDLKARIRVKRGILGDATDQFQLMWSGQTAPDSIGIQGAAHMIEVETED